ncbi:MAG: phage tail tape measure protein [Clostridiales bacterium]|nr:phage tail tape measure protein [Clostridiales bacterium]
MAKIAGITIKLDADASGIENALRGIDSDLKKTQSNLKNLNKALKFDPKNTDLLTQKQKALKDAIQLTKDRVEQLKQAQSQVAKGSAEWDALQQEIVMTESSLKQLEQEYRNFGSVAKQQLIAVGDQIKSTGDKIAGVGQKLTKNVTAPIVAVGTAASAAAISFETSFAKLSTIADTTEVSVEDLKNQIMDLSSETGLSASAVSEAAYSAISAGQSTGDALEFVATAAKLAKGGFTDVSTATDVLTTALNAYGLSADQVTHVSDVLIETQNEGKTTVAELASAMGKVIPTAAAAGVGIEDLSSQYVALTKNGIATAEATTYINGMLNELTKNGSSAFNAFKEAAGVTFPEYIAQGHSTAEAMQLLSQYTEEAGLKVTDVFGSAEAGKAANVLVSHTEDATTALENMAKQSGQTQDAFETMEGTTATRLEKMKTSLQNLAITFGETILPIIEPIIQKITEGFAKISEMWNSLSPETQNMIVKALAIAAAIGPILVVIGKVVSGVGSLIGVLGSLASPVGIVIAVIAAVIAIGVLLYKNWDTIKAKATEMWENIKAKWEEFKTTTAATFESIKTSLVEKWNSIKETVVTAVSNLKDSVSNAWQTLKDKISGVIDSIKSKIDTLKEKFDTLKERCQKIIEDIKNIFKGEISFPHIKLPHFSVSGGVAPYGLGGQGSLPSFSVSWYRKAYDNPIMFTQPTVLATAAGMKGFGDGSGAEIVMSLEKLQQLVGSQGDRPVVVQVSLEGDARGLFKAVQKTNLVRTKATNYNALAVGG